MSLSPAISALFGLHSSVMISSMLGLGGCGVTRNQRAEARLSQVEATRSGRSSSTVASPNTAREKAP